MTWIKHSPSNAWMEQIMNLKHKAYQHGNQLFKLIYEDWPAKCRCQLFIHSYSYLDGIPTTTLTLISVKDTLDETSGKKLRIECSLKTQEGFKAYSYCCLQKPHLIS